MEDNILVTFLFVIVSILLIVDIVIAVTIYKVLKRFQTLVDKADSVTDNISNIAKIASGVATTGTISKIVKATAEKFSSEKGNKNGKKNK